MSQKYLIFPEKFPRFPDSRQNLQIPGINLFFSRNSPCWSCHPPYATETHLHKLLDLQKRALRLIFFAEPRTHAVLLFLETKQFPISFLLFEQMSLLMYDVHNNLDPDNTKNMFTKLSSVHSYQTRGSFLESPDN